MNSQPINHRLSFRKSGAFSVRAAFIACVLLAVSAVPSLKAQTASITGSCQTLIENYLTSHAEGTILTSSSTNLAHAVAMVIKSNTNTALPSYYFAWSAMLPYPYGTNGSTGAVRTDVSPSFNRDAAAALVTGSAIAQIVATGTNSNISATTFKDDIALAAKDILEVSGSDTSKNLTQTGRVFVLRTAIASIINAYDPASANIKPLDVSACVDLGEKILADPFLEGLPSRGLQPIVEGGIFGLTSGTDPAIAPSIANEFVLGLITTGSGTFSWPDRAQGITSSQFAVNILANIYGNGACDVLIAHDFSTRIYNNNSGNLSALVSLGQSLFTAYTTAHPATQIALAQGLIAGVTQGVNQETLRIQFTKSLTSAEIASAANIEEGAIYTDPYYAGSFTSGIFGSVKASSNATLIADAPTIATDAGTVLGADGNSLTQVAGVFGTYIGNGSLSGTSAGTYASNMIKAAQTSTVASFAVDAWGNGGGGKLNLTQGSITTATVTDLASITDVLAGGIRTYYAGLGTLNTTGASAFASQVGILAEDVAKIITTETFNGSVNSGHSGLVAEFVAATLADYIVALNVGSTAQADALADIKTDVDAAVNNSTDNTAINNAVNESVTHNNGYGNVSGPIAVQETTVTNL